MFKTEPQDNSSLLLKTLLRKSLLDLRATDRGTVLDLFAGRGEIAVKVYGGFREVHLVEKNSKQFAVLENKFAACPSVRLWRMDNLKFIAQKLALFPELRVVEFDAYGTPNHQIKLFFENHKLKKPLLVFATDGFRIARIRGANFSPQLYFAGPDRGSVNRYDPVLDRHNEALIRTFWDGLAARHNFRILLFKLLRKKGGQVVYYGTWIEPK